MPTKSNAVMRENTRQKAKRYREQLGMGFGKATNRLRKNLMFHLIQRLGLDVCHQCGEKIKTVENLSIDHKKPWRNEDNASDLFFDLDNIAYSHLKCNAGAGRRAQKHGTVNGYKRGCRCRTCKAAHAKRQRELRAKRK